MQGLQRLSRTEARCPPSGSFRGNEEGGLDSARDTKVNENKTKMVYIYLAPGTRSANDKYKIKVMTRNSCVPTKPYKVDAVIVTMGEKGKLSLGRRQLGPCSSHPDLPVS